jgi:tetratricopeptide (TPR) repeat protein
MFLDRADARAPGYGEGETEMLDVERICRGLDGLPLALELAAARAPLLSPRELADRLTRVLDVLGPGPSDAPARQRTLRATLEWSVRLLDEEERAAFARLGAFAGGMTIASAEAVAGVGLDTLDSLVAKQLLARRGDRLVMLETVRAFALERLAEDPHASSVRRALAGWCLDGLRAGNPRIRGRQRRARLAQLEAELANAVASLGWAIEVSDTKLAMDLAAELGTFWWNTSRREEGIRWLGLALETAPDSDPADLAAVLLARARLTHRRDMPAYRRDLEAALTRFTEAADRGGMALALAYLSYVEASTGRADAAASLARRARVFADECGDELIRGTVLGETQSIASRHEEVDQMRREAVELLSRNDDLVGVAFTCSVAGYEALAAQRDADALPWLEESAKAARLSGHLASLCHVHNNLGLARLFTGDVDGATEALATALRLARPAGSEHLTDEAVLAMSAIRLRQGDPTETAAALRTAASTQQVITRRPDEQVVWARIEDELIAPYRCQLDEGSAAARSPQLSLTQAIELAIAETERAVASAKAR